MLKTECQTTQKTELLLTFQSMDLCIKKVVSIETLDWFKLLLAPQQWCGRVIFVESRVESSHKPFESESSQSHLNFFRVKSESSHGLVESSQSRVTKSVESFRVTSLPFQVNVESNEIKHCHYFVKKNIFSFFCFMKKNEMKISFFSNKILFL